MIDGSLTRILNLTPKISLFWAYDCHFKMWSQSIRMGFSSRSSPRSSVLWAKRAFSGDVKSKRIGLVGMGHVGNLHSQFSQRDKIRIFMILLAHRDVLEPWHFLGGMELQQFWVKHLDQSEKNELS